VARHNSDSDIPVSLLICTSTLSGTTLSHRDITAVKEKNNSIIFSEAMYQILMLVQFNFPNIEIGKRLERV
jgi:hypothetical protein